LASQKALWYLKQTGLFQFLHDAELKKLALSVKEREVKRRDLVYSSGHPGRTIHVLKEGRVKLSRTTEDGRTITLDILEPGDLFGEIAPPGERPGETVAEALEDSYVCAMSRETFDLMLRAKPELALRVLEQMDERRRKFEIRLEELLFRDVPARLSRLLLRLAEEHGTMEPEGARVRLGLTHEELANLIASSRETVSKFMSEFRARGLIDYDQKSILLIDLPSLQNQAG